MFSPRTFTATIVTGVIAAALLIGVDGWPGEHTSLLIANPDCESIGTGLLRQPVGAISSLAFVAVGIWSVGEGRIASQSRLLLSGGFVAVGVGSFLGHAAQTDWARRLDSFAIKAMLAAFVVVALGRIGVVGPRRKVLWWLLITLGTVAVESAWRESGDPLLAALSILAATFTLLAAGPRGRRLLLTGLTVVVAAAALWWLGRDDGPLCHPDTVFQLHGAWHILAAAGLALASLTYEGDAA